MGIALLAELANIGVYEVQSLKGASYLIPDALAIGVRGGEGIGQQIPESVDFLIPMYMEIVPRRLWKTTSCTNRGSNSCRPRSSSFAQRFATICR